MYTKYDVESPSIEAKSVLLSVLKLNYAAKVRNGIKVEIGEEEYQYLRNEAKNKAVRCLLEAVKSFIDVRGYENYERCYEEVIATISLPYVKDQMVQDLESKCEDYYKSMILTHERNKSLMAEINDTAKELNWYKKSWYKKLVRILQGKGERK